ncbi:hypothetical protein [Lentibacillus amyloliquefaciens]|nr:hypothetical protein [Lentibacillus amyloliquefaciens]
MLEAWIGRISDDEIEATGASNQGILYILTEEHQWEKLRHIARIAQDVWK